MSSSSGWRWRPKGEWAAGLGPAPLLRYEPGNWGDVLKASWLPGIVGSRLERLASGSTFRYLDPFAGCPTYPCGPSPRRRIPHEDTELRSLLDPFGDDRWPSSALLVAEAVQSRGGRLSARVHDADPARRALWESSGGFELPQADVSCGSELLVSDPEAPWDLVLVDPYDFFHRWGRWLRSSLRLATESLVLIYLYDKSPRGAGHEDQYRRFRDGLRRELPAAVRACHGRLAADVRAPTAHHEVLLLGPAEELEALAPRLAAVTRRLSREQGAEPARPPFDGPGVNAAEGSSPPDPPPAL